MISFNEKRKTGIRSLVRIAVRKIGVFQAEAELLAIGPTLWMLDARVDHGFAVQIGPLILAMEFGSTVGGAR